MLYLVDGASFLKEMCLLHHHRKSLFFMYMLNICSKIVHGEFCPYKSTLPTAEAKWEGKYPSLSGERTKMYFLPFQVSLDTKLRAFQYKLSRIVYTSHMTNYRLC